jgi:hypothetical protein
MNIPAQLLPHKHIRFCESLIGLAGFIRQLLFNKPRTIDQLYILILNSNWLYEPSFEQVVSAVVILFSIGEIFETDDNKIMLRVKNQDNATLQKTIDNNPKKVISVTR